MAAAMPERPKWKNATQEQKEREREGEGKRLKEGPNLFIFTSRDGFEELAPPLADGNSLLCHLASPLRRGDVPRGIRSNNIWVSSVVQQLRDNSRDNTCRQALFLDDAAATPWPRVVTSSCTVHVFISVALHLREPELPRRALRCAERVWLVVGARKSRGARRNSRFGLRRGS